MFNILDNVDYILALLDKDCKAHYRYITTGTSGSYQLAYGFLKPLVVEETFTQNRYLTCDNAILYSNNDLKYALEKCINQSNADYSKMVSNLEKTVNYIRETSKNNLKELLDNKEGSFYA